MKEYRLLIVLHKMRSSAALVYACAIAALAAIVAVALVTGRYPLSFADPQMPTILLEIRAPRVAAALLVGASLAAAGAAYQAIFRNPLVSPDILGVSTGAALGAALGMILSLDLAAVQAFAFAGGLAAVALVYWIGSRMRAHDRLLALVLTGIVIGTLFGAGVALLKVIADPANQLPAITFWLLGSLASVAPRELAVATPLALIGLAPLIALRWRINLLALGDDEARALGADAARLRAVVIAGATLMSAAAVALAGIIGWIGLLVPHAARLLVGPDVGRLLPLAMLLGAAFMLAVDTLCRSIAAVEIPPGVLTALLGTPLFLWLFAVARRTW